MSVTAGVCAWCLLATSGLQRSGFQGDVYEHTTHKHPGAESLLYAGSSGNSWLISIPPIMLLVTAHAHFLCYTSPV